MYKLQAGPTGAILEIENVEINSNQELVVTVSYD